MSRHYMNHSISQLEGVVDAAERGRNYAGLRAVRDELKHRSTQRAKELLARVEELILTLKTGPDPAKTSGAGQLELGVGDPLPIDIPVLVPSPASPELPTPPVKAAPSKATPRLPLPVFGAQEAAKVLGVPLTARWDVVEAARASLVHAAIFPTAQGAQPGADAARQINGAYASLHASRRY